ncbi:hypothetical protein ONA92_27020 [Mycobacteroides salmoniphilum]|uniref:hypothetical protein n=1 Tax=Mycobacteroides salmoniphilum TaxID=404941 RepID=UPI0035696619
MTSTLDKGAAAELEYPYSEFMTAQYTPVVYAPPGQVPVQPAPAGGVPGWAGPPPVPPAGPGKRRNNGQIAVWAAMGVALVTSMVALVIGLVAMKTAMTQTTAASTTTVTAPAATPVLFDDTADRALCQALPDLMRERDKSDNAYHALPTNSPERVAAMPSYKSGVEDWARRTEAVLAEHASPATYLTRTLQRYIDDVLLYSQNIYPEKPADRFDTPTWTTSVVSYGGALGRCQQLGIRW